MKPADRKAYLQANVCVMKSPARLPSLKKIGAKTRWDELVAMHQVMALQIHSTGSFLPFHRYFIKVHETLLQECGYRGALAYWWEPLDAGKFISSPLLDPVLGFGGDGAGTGNCVPNGPFVGLNVNIGPGFNHTARCVNRKINDAFGSPQTAQSFVDDAMRPTTYKDAWLANYMGPHLYGHIGLAMMVCFFLFFFFALRRFPP
jgi:tyrosinase